MEQDRRDTKEHRENKKMKVVNEFDLDLDLLCSSYTGNARIERLIFVGQCCLPLRVDAYEKAMKYIKETNDVRKHEEIAGKLKFELEKRHLPYDLDENWVSTHNRQNKIDIDRLDQELQNYKSNLIKESIRMGHNEIAEKYYSMGDLQSALKHIQLTRDYLTAPSHILEMSLKLVEYSMELQNYPVVQGYIIKALQVPNIDLKSKSKIESIQAMLQLEQFQYKNAAELFLKIPFEASDHLWQFVCARDVCVYGGLSSLAVFNRKQLKEKVLENQEFKHYLELEPMMRELIRAFYSSKFQKCFEILLALKKEFVLDCFIQKHIDGLFHEIRCKSMVQYMFPFQSLRLDAMANVFLMTTQELESQIYNLILDGQIDAKIDNQNKIVRARGKNLRKKLYEDTLKGCRDLRVTTENLLLRSQLIQAKMIIKARDSRDGRDFR